MEVGRPLWINRFKAPGAEAFAMLYGLESITRALVVTLLPIEALRLLGDVQKVSLFFFAISITGIFATLIVGAEEKGSGLFSVSQTDKSELEGK